MEAVDDLARGRRTARALHGRRHGVDDALRAGPEERELVGALDRAQLLEQRRAVDEGGRGERRCERPRRGLGEEPGLDRDRRGPQAELAHERAGGVDRQRRAHAAVADVPDPRGRVLVAPAIQRAVDEERQVGPAARVAEQREIALDADRVEVREERAVVAEQVAHVVTRRGQHEIDAGLLHQGVELGAVERRDSRCGLICCGA